MTASGRCHGAPVRTSLEEVHVLREVARAEEEVPDLVPGGGPQAVGLVRPLDEGYDGIGEGLEVKGVHQQTVLAVPDLVLDASYPAGNHRAALPHRLGYRQPEPLREALLHDDGGSPLKRVDHRSVLRRIVHGE